MILIIVLDLAGMSSQRSKTGAHWRIKQWTRSKLEREREMVWSLVWCGGMHWGGSVLGICGSVVFVLSHVSLFSVIYADVHFLVGRSIINLCGVPMPNPMIAMGCGYLPSTSFQCAWLHNCLTRTRMQMSLTEIGFWPLGPGLLSIQKSIQTNKQTRNQLMMIQTEISCKTSP